MPFITRDRYPTTYTHDIREVKDVCELCIMRACEDGTCDAIIFLIQNYYINNILEIYILVFHTR